MVVDTERLESPAPPQQECRIWIGGAGMIPRIAQQWRALCVDSAYDCPAVYPEWFEAYFASFDHEQEPLVATAFRDAQLAAVLPLLRTRIWYCGLPVTLLHPAANYHSPRFEWIAARSLLDQELVDAFVDALAEIEWDVFRLSYVPEGGLTAELHASAARRFLVGKQIAHRVPFLTLPSRQQSDHWWPASARPHFVSKIRKRTQRVLSAPDSRLERILRPSEEELEDFLQLEASGWKGKTKTAITSRPETKTFYCRLARTTIGHGDFTLYYLKYHGKLIAADLGLTTATTYYSLKCAYDEAFSSLSPGHVLTNLVLRDCIRPGTKVFDFCGADGPSKRCWTREFIPVSTLYWYRPTLPGRLLHFAQMSVKPPFRRILPASVLRYLGNERSR
jgi:CelD/BcsL family acetyltransferase involved in cellulose biosynthesis